MNEVQRKILIACFEVPGWGGASTACYRLFEMLQKDGLDVSLVNIIGEHDVGYFEYYFGGKMGNPRGLNQVFNCRLVGNNYRYHESLHQLIESISPDLLVAVGWIAAYIIRQADARRKLIYMTTGCGYMKKHINQKKGNDFLSFKRDQLRNGRNFSGASKLEKEAFALADLVVAHSSMNLRLHQALYASSAGKIYSNVVWFSEWIYQDALAFQHLRQPFEEREIDVLLIANDWSRPEKNLPLTRGITRKLRDLNIHMVGELSEKVPGVRHRAFIPNREAMFRLMGNAKVVVSTSAFDAAPGILFEASAMHCNVVASRNCGNWQLCNSELLVDPVSVQGFNSKVRLASTRKFDDNISFFKGKESYEDLKDLVSIF